MPPKRGGHVKTTPAQLRAVGSSGLCRKLLKLCPQLFGAGDLALIELHAQSVADVALQEQRVLADTISSHLLKQPGLEISRSVSRKPNRRPLGPSPGRQQAARQWPEIPERSCRK